MKLFKLILCVTLLLSLTACGFHARNKNSLPPQLSTLAIENSNLRSNLTAQLTESLQELGVKVVQSPTQSPITLQIINDSISQSSSILGTAQQLNTVYLSYNVTFVLRNNHQQNIIAPITSTTSTTYFQNANQILGDSTAIPQLQQELIRSNIQKIIAYLGSEKTRQALAKPTSP